MRRNQQPPEKTENFFEVWMKLFKYSKSYLFLFLLALLLAAGGNVLTVIGPNYIGELTNVIQDGLGSTINMDAITRIGFILLTLYGLSGAFSLFQGLIMVTITQRISQSLRSDISKKINRLPMAYFSNTTVGDTLSRVTNDVNTLSQSLNNSVRNLVTSGTMLVGSLVMMLLTNGWMTLTAIGATLIGIVLMGLIMVNSQKYFIQQQNKLGDVNGQIEEIYSGHTVVKAYNGENKARADFDQMNYDLRDSGFKAQALSGLMQPIMTFIGNFGYVAVCVVGAILTITGNISFGVVVAFIMYVRYFTQPLAQIAQSFQALQSAAAAGERVFELLEEDEMADESTKTTRLKNIEGEVEFSNVQFRYANTEKPVIKNFSAQAKPGQKIAIVGHTGAGKTTIVNLLMRFYEIDQGQITIDGTSIQEITRENVHEQFCMVLQDTWIFEATIRENLVYNTPNVSEETLIQASKAVGIDHFIRTLPKGYDTILDDQANLSHGQKQQLTIARAIIADKPMLILDEATSSVDTRTEVKIQEAMDALMEGRTSFIIAHRLSTIKNADTILVLEEGDVIESGAHDELIAQNGVYTELYNSQFEEAS
jgi:ATP-binding cassette subfamily B protein